MAEWREYNGRKIIPREEEAGFCSALMEAIKSGAEDLIELLLASEHAKWVDPARLCGAFQAACESGRSDFVSALAKAWPRADWPKIWPAAMVAVASKESRADFWPKKKDYAQCAKLLASLGYELEAKAAGGVAPLTKAIEAKNLPMVEALIDLGAKTDIRAGSMGLLWWAARRDATPIVARLVQAGLRLSEDESARGWLEAREAVRSGSIARLDCWLMAGIDARSSDAEGSLLHDAAKAGNAEAMARILAAGSDLEARDAKGRTALFFAAVGRQAGSQACALALGSAGARSDESFPVGGVGLASIERIAEDSGKSDFLLWVRSRRESKELESFVERAPCARRPGL